jgi:hypothetical protein
MKKLLIPAIATLSLGVSGLALAGTTNIGVGYDNVAVNLGNGVSSSVPTGKLAVEHVFSGNYGVNFGLTGGSGNGLTYWNIQTGADKRLPFDGGVLSPRIMIGATRVGIEGGNAYHVSTAYAGFGASYSYPIGRYVALDGNAAMGRDFATHVTGLNTVGGLFYQAGADAVFRGVGPGLFKVGYEYRHLPISVANDIHINTSGFQAQYSIAFG